MPPAFRSSSPYALFLLCTLVSPVFPADPASYVDRAAVQQLADKLSTHLHDLACDQLRTGPLHPDKECNSVGLKQLFESLNIKPTLDFTPNQYLVQQILPQVQAVLDTVRRFIFVGSSFYIPM